VTYENEDAQGVRLQRVLAAAGLGSRRACEQLIEEGRVEVDGAVVADQGLRVDPRTAVIHVNGLRIASAPDNVYLMLNKPTGVLSTMHDPEGRLTVADFLGMRDARLFHVGRLDADTEGLLLLTNDGALARHLELPATGWLRRYRVRAHGTVSQEALDKLKDGIEIAGTRYGPIEATLDKVQPSNVWLSIGLREGKNREVRTVLETLGLAVNRLIRISFGPFQLLDLEPGAVEPVKRRVLMEQMGPRVAAELGLTDEEDAPPRETKAPRKRKGWA